MKHAMRGGLILLLLTACTSVTVRKIGDDGKPTGPSGVRYYMNRPYVSVYEPFVVGAKPFIVGGELSADGRYVLINDVDRLDKDEGKALRSHFLAKGDRSVRIPSHRVVAAPKAAADGGDPGLLQGGPQAGPTDGAPDGSTADDDDTPVSHSTQEQAGTLNLKVTNDNSAFAITKLKRYYDIVYLPDFDEQYVVEGNLGLGNGSVNLGLGQGWSLQGLDANVDNGPIARRLLNLMDHGAGMLTSLSPAAAATIPGALAGETTLAGGPQAGASVKDGVVSGDFNAGMPVSVKITLVRIVAPGLYPILKPKELRDFQLLKHSACAECGHTCNLELYETKFGERLLMPVPPFTNIAFNTYTIAVVEATRAFGDSALQPAPPAGGPQGGRGAPFAPAPLVPEQPDLSGGPQAGAGDLMAPTIDLSALEQSLNTYFLRCRAASKPYWSVKLSPGTEAGTVSAVLTSEGGGAGVPRLSAERAADVVRQTVSRAGAGSVSGVTIK